MWRMHDDDSDDFDDFGDYGDSEMASDSEKSDLPIIVTQKKEVKIQSHAPILEPGSLPVRDLQLHARNGDTVAVGRFLAALHPAAVNGVENGAGDDAQPPGRSPADVDVGSGWTALMHAAAAGQEAVVELLLAHGADPGLRAPDGTSPILAAAASPAVDDEPAAKCVRRLIEAGASVNEVLPPPDDFGKPNPALALDIIWSPLHAAARANRSILIATLIDSGAAVDARDRFDWTPLMVAADAGSLAAVNMLLSRGAEPRLRIRPRRGADPGTIDANAAVLASMSGHSTLADALRVACGETAGDERLYRVLRRLREETEEEEERAEEGMEEDVKEKADELATFLHGLRLVELLPKMKAQGVTLSLLMRTSDSQLREIGVERLADRTKILNTVHEMHKVAWTEDKPQHLEFGKPLKLRDLVAVAGHTSRHVEFLDASISFVNSHLNAYTDFYVGAVESRPNAPAMLQSVDAVCEEGLESCRHLFANLCLLRRHTAAIRGEAAVADVPDLIPPTERKQKRRRLPRILLPAVGAILIFSILRHRRALTELMTSLKL